MTDAILFILISSLSAMHPEAAGKAAQAYFKQSGAESNIERQFDSELRAKAGTVTLIAKTLVERKVVLEWRF